MGTRATGSGTRKLSEVARHVCVPQGIVSTGWQAVRAQCKRMDTHFDRWQDGIGRLVLAKRADGQYAASVGGVVLSIPRQTGKTYTIGWIVFALCILFPRTTVIWTAHRLRTAKETFQAMKTMAQKPKVAGFILAVHSGKGEEQVVFENGSRIMFGAREQGFGRGFAEVDVLVLDEAQILTEDAMSDMVPATNAAPNGLVLMMGTPPRPKDPGEVFRARRADALDGDPDTLYVEFSADKGADLDDWGQLAKANPSFPHRTSKTAIQRMRKLLGSDESFRREAFGIWDEVGGEPVITGQEWRVLLEEDTPDEPAVFGIKFSVDGALVGVAAAVKSKAGPVHVSGIRLASTGEGVAWIVELLEENRDRVAQIVIDGKAGAQGMVEALVEAGFRARAKAPPPGRFIRIPTVAEYVESHVLFLKAVREQELLHDGSETLTRQATTAQRRKIGNLGGWGWEPPGEMDDVTLLDAATIAVWGAKTTTRRGRRRRG